MPRAMVFINTRSDSDELVRELLKVEGISEAHAAVGMYEAVALVQADSFSKVKDIVAKQIRSRQAVKSTLTLTLIEAQ